MKSALAGATTMASASRLKLMWAMLLLAPPASRLSHWLVNTGRALRACMVTGVMNAVATSVMTTCTLAPAFTNARHNSAPL